MMLTLMTRINTSTRSTTPLNTEINIRKSEQIKKNIGIARYRAKLPRSSLPLPPYVCVKPASLKRDFKCLTVVQGSLKIEMVVYISLSPLALTVETVGTAMNQLT